MVRANRRIAAIKTDASARTYKCDNKPVIGKSVNVTRLRRNPVRFLFASIVVVPAFMFLQRLGEEFLVESLETDVARHGTIAIFGATGTAGDGILKAAMNDPDVTTIHVVTRRLSPRIEAGVLSDLVETTTHKDYLDYSSLKGLLEKVDRVYWALGTSSLNVTNVEYGVIHVDFPLSLARDWMSARESGEMSFHLVSGMGAGVNARLHWEREKARAESELFDLAEGTNMRVISYRPAYIVPAEEHANLGHNLVHAIFAPIKLAVRSTVIGEAMLHVSARGKQVGNGTIFENRDIVEFGNDYRERHD